MKFLRWNIITDEVMDEYVKNEVEHYTKHYKEQADYYKEQYEEVEKENFYLKNHIDKEISRTQRIKNRRVKK